MLLMGLQTFAQVQIMNDANAQKRTLNGSFSAIEVSDGVELYLSQGNEESIAVSASDNKYLERYHTEVVNGTLKIYYDSKGITWSGNDKRKLKAYVSFKTLEKLKASAGADVNMTSVFTGDKLDCTFSSGARFEGEIKVKRANVYQSSGAEMNITGRADELKVDVSSGAIFKGYDFAVDFCEAKASSGGGVRVNVNKELSVEARSGGGIRYRGEGVIKDMDVSSGGLVKKS